MDGSNRTVLTTTMVFHPFAITYYDGFLYWSDWQTDQIFTTHVSNPNDVRVFVQTLDTEPMGLEVVSSSRQPISEPIHTMLHARAHTHTHTHTCHTHTHTHTHTHITAQHNSSTTT